MITVVEISALEKPELAPVFARIRHHIERYGPVPLGTVTLHMTQQQAMALAALMGTSQLRTGRVRIELARLDSALRSSRLHIGLLDVLERLGGEIVNHRQTRAAATARESAMWERLRVKAVALNPALESWLSKVRARGTARKLVGEDPEPMLEQVLSVISELPCDHVSLQRLAVRFGSAHALDWNRPLGSLSLSARAHLQGEEAPSSAARRRRLWLEFGVLLDTLSATVLTLNLRAASGNLVGTILNACTAAREPASLTLGQLMLAPLTFAPGHPPVLVCENPAVMEHVKGQANHAPAMVCVAGRFNTAAATLLQYLVSSGVALRYHGDFDFPGIAIANEVVARFGAVPWKYDTASYLHAIARHPGHPLSERRVEASWDPELASSLVEHQRAIHEEAVVDDLLDQR